MYNSISFFLIYKILQNSKICKNIHLKLIVGQKIVNLQQSKYYLNTCNTFPLFQYSDNKKVVVVLGLYSINGS